MLQNVFRRVNKHKPYPKRPLNVNFIDQRPSSESSTSSPIRSLKQQEGDLSKGLSSVVDRMPQSYHEQSKRLLTYLAESEHLPIDDKKNEVLVYGKIYNLIYLIYDVVMNCKRLESIDSHLYKFLKSPNFPKVVLGINTF